MTEPRRLSPAQRFGIRFFGILAALSVAAWAINLPSQLGGVQRSIAAAAGVLARLSGGANLVSGDNIRAGSIVVHVNYECTGIYVLLILLTFLAAYPASWRARAAGVLIGTAGLIVLNVFRIAFLVRIAELQPGLFSYLHEYVWQGVFLVLVIAYAMKWIEHLR